MMRLSRALTRPNAAKAALRSSTRNYVVASQTQKAQEATVSTFVEQAISGVMYSRAELWPAQGVPRH